MLTHFQRTVVFHFATEQVQHHCLASCTESGLASPPLRGFKVSLVVVFTEAMSNNFQKLDISLGAN